jgi:hypothetical protein
MNQKSNLYFFFWFLALWGITSWAFFELTFPRLSFITFYGVPLIPLTIVILTSIVILFVGAGVFRHFREKELTRRGTQVFVAAFAVATLVFIIVAAPYVVISSNNRARVQWYIDDLRSQCFDVEYSAQYPYNRGDVSHVFSYENLTSIAKDLNCSWVGVYGGAPYYFIFFFPSTTDFLINQNGQYLLRISW